MKTKTILAGVLFVLYILCAAKSASAQSVPGGVAASNGKHVFYRDFQSGETERITAHLEGAVKPPFAVSEDGKTLVWMTDDGKLRTCMLPLGSEHTIKRNTARVKGEVILKEHDFELFNDRGFDMRCQTLKDQEVTNFSLSPLGTKLCFEADMMASGGWTLVPAGHPLYQGWWARNGRSGFLTPEIARLPMYTECEPGDFHGIMVAGIAKDLFISMNIRCGNSYEYPAVPKWKPTKFIIPGGGILTEHTSVLKIFSNINISWPVEECCKRFSYRRDAHFAAWSKDDKMLAVIYQTAPDNWGPIEIRIFNFVRQKQQPSVKKGEANAPLCEISLKLPSCQGLAWMPNGSLTFQAENKVWMIDSDQITRGIADSGIVKVVGGRDNSYVSSRLNPATVVVNNVFQVQPIEIPSYPVEGTKLCWVSDSSFIIRGNDKALYLYNVQNNAMPQKLVREIPEDFFYCRFSPPDEAMVAKVSSFKNPDSVYPEAKSGVDRVLAENKGPSFGSRPQSEIGTFKIRWEHIGFDNGKLINLRIAYPVPENKHKRGAKPKKEFALPKAKSLDEIKDPSAYQFQEKEPVSWGPNSWPVKLGKGDIIVFRYDDSYAALQVLDIGIEWLNYCWKFWPEVKAGNTDLAKAKLLTKASNPRDSESAYSEITDGLEAGEGKILGRSKGSGKLPTAEIGTIKFSWSPGGLFNGNQTAGIYVQNTPAEGKRTKLQFTVIGYKGLDDIKNPLPHTYRTASAVQRLSKNQVIIYRDGGSFTGIQVMDFGAEWMNYCWKFWPDVTKKVELVTAD